MITKVMARGGVEERAGKLNEAEDKGEEKIRSMGGTR